MMPLLRLSTGFVCKYPSHYCYYLHSLRLLERLNILARQLAHQLSALLDRLGRSSKRIEAEIHKMADTHIETTCGKSVQA